MLFRSQEIRKDRHSQRSRGSGSRDSEGGGGEGRGEERVRGAGEGGGETTEVKGIELPLAAPDLLPGPDDLEDFKVDEYRDLSKGSFDTGDPLTTNLYVGNINPKVHLKYFARTQYEYS